MEQQQPQTISLASIVSLHHVGETSFARAWLLSYAPSRYFALPLQACHELVEFPEIITVPGVAHYSLGLLSWRQQWLPLIDMNSLITGEPAKLTDNSHCVVVAYRAQSGNIAYAALSLHTFPQLIEVKDEAICALPEKTTFDWSTIASSCFRYADSRVPVIEGSQLFSVYHEIS